MNRISAAALCAEMMTQLARYRHCAGNGHHNRVRCISIAEGPMPTGSKQAALTSNRCRDAY